MIEYNIGVDSKKSMKVKSHTVFDVTFLFCGQDGTRTRDLRRDRAAF